MGLLAIGHTSVINVNDGQKGDQGQVGATIKSEKKQWYLSTSSTSLSGGSWSDTQPTVIPPTDKPNNKYLWERTVTTLTNNTVVNGNAFYNATIAGIISKADTTEKKITDKVWQADITSSINAYDGSTGNAIRDRVTATETDLSGIHSTISDMQSTIEEKADGSTVETLSNNVNTINNTVNGHTQSISSINTNLSKKADSSTVTALTQRVATVEQTAEGFRQTVESTYATKESVDNIKIGTKNYIDNSEVFDLTKDPYKSSTCTTTTASKKDGVSAYDTTPSNKIIVNFPPLIADREYVFSYEWNRCWASYDLITKVGSETKTTPTVNDNLWHREVLKFTASSTTDHAEIYINDTSKRTIYVRHLQLEEGNLVSDWHPSETDLKSYADTQVATAKSEIKQTTDAITSTVSKKVGNDEIISKINQSAETIQISANKVNLVGSVTFSMLDSTTQTAITSLGSELIESTHTTSTSAWTGESEILAEIVAGTRIAYRLNQAPANADVTLDLTLKDGSTTGPKPVYYSNTTVLKKQYPINSIIQLIYDGDEWRVVNPYTDTNSDHYDRVRYQQVIKAWGTNIPKSNIIVAEANNTGLYMPLNTGNDFDTTYPILYANSAITANSTGNDNYLMLPFSLSTTQAVSFEPYKAVYIKGKLSGTNFKPISSTPLTQDIPEFADNYHYILLGTMYSSTAMYLLNEHPIYMYYNGGFKTTSQIASEAAVNADTANNTLANINIYDIVTTYGTSTSPSTQPTSWQTTVPSWSNGTYIWQKTITTDKNGQEAEDIVCLTGQKGATGNAGKDAYTVILTNESHTFAGNTTSAIGDTIECGIIGYKGTTQIATTIGTISGTPTGMTITPSGSGTTSAKLTIKATSSLTSTSGIVTIPITIDSKTFNKTFSYALALTGSHGYNTAVLYLYKRATSTPTVPTANVKYTFATKEISCSDFGGWSTTVPSGTNPCYVITATATSQGDFDTIESSEWSTPIVMVQNGAKGDKGDKGDQGNKGDQGDKGYNQATLYLYKRATSASKPGNLTYKFSTGALQTASGWSRSIPETDANHNPCWVTSVSVMSTSDDVTISGTNWSTPTKLVEDGDDATSYSLIVSPNAIKLSGDGTTYDPKSITVSATSKTGTGAVTAYAGRFKLETTNDWSTWSQPSGTGFVSSGNESTKTFDTTNLTGYVGLRCSLYLAGGTTTLLDQQTIPVISDGGIGETGVGVASIVPYYALSASKPTTTPKTSTSVWNTTPQAYSSGSKYWTSSLITYTDGNTVATEVVEHKGLNTAISTANTANTTANTAKSTADTAKSTADTAKSTADTAKSSADLANDKANITLGMMSLGMKVNYSTFSASDPGEVYLHGFTNGVASDTSGYVYWNDRKITVAKTMLNPGNICPFLKTIYIVLRLSSATATSGTLYMVWWDTNNSVWKSAQAPTPSARASWSWIEDRDIVLGQFIEPSSEGAIIDAYIYDPPRKASYITATSTDAPAYSQAAIDWVHLNGPEQLNAVEMLKFWTDNALNKTTKIQGGYIATNTIKTENLATDAIMSSNYVSGRENSHYSADGSFFDLENGNIYTRNFGVDNDNGGAYINGTIIADSGSIGRDQDNCWTIGTKQDNDGNNLGYLVANGKAYIESGKLMLTEDKLNTQYYNNSNNTITYPNYSSKYYDMGMQAANPNDATNAHGKNFLYIRKSTKDAIPAVNNDSIWEYPFRVTTEGVIYATGLIINGNEAGALYVPLSGDSTISGSVTMNGLTVKGTIVTTSGLSKYITINGKQYNGSSTSGDVDVGTIDVEYGGTGTTSLASGQVLIGNGTNAVTTRGIKNITSRGNLGWTSATADNTLVTTNTLAYWNGQYKSGASNIEYVSQGKLGSIVTKDVDDYLSTSGGVVDGSIQAVDINTGNLVVNGSARVVGDLYGNLTGIATHAIKVKDSGNNNDTTFAYSKTALTSPTEFAAWNGYELRKINSSNMLSAIGAMPASKTFSQRDLVPLMTKEYTDVICTGNSDPAGYLFFMTVRANDSWTNLHSITYRVTATIKGVSQGKQVSIIHVNLMRNTYTSYYVWNNIQNASYRPIYGHPFYMLKEAGYNAGYGSIWGLRFQSSYNPATAANSRTIKIEILDYEGCTITFFDQMTLYADVAGSGTTNFENRGAFDGTTGGMTMSGDRNNYERLRQLYTHLTAGENGMKQYSLVMEDSTGKWQSFTTTNGIGNTKTLNTSTGFKLGQIYYLSTGSNYNSGGVNGNDVVYIAMPAIDIRYTLNCGQTLTSNKPVYVVGTMNNGLFYLDATTPYTQDQPTSADGKVYIFLGMALSSYQVDFYGWKGAYYHDGTIFRQYIEARADENGNSISSTYVKKSGDTMSGNLTVSNTSPTLTISNSNGGSSSMIFERVGSSHADWRIINDGGNLRFQNDYTDKLVSYFDVLKLDYNTGKATFKNEVNATTFIGSLSGNATSATSAIQLSQSTITDNNLNSFINDSNLIYSSSGGSNSITGKPTGVDAFGVMSFKTAEGWYGQLLMSSNAQTGLYWRTATSFTNVSWNKLLDSSNYQSYTVTKTGGGASGTWGIGITGNAKTATSASSAAKLTSAVNITVGGETKSFDGSSGVNFAKDKISGLAVANSEDTGYTANAGWMSGADKAKLDSISVSAIGTVGANSIKGEGGINVTISNGVATVKHENSQITGSTASAGTSTSTTNVTNLSFGTTINIPSIKYDNYGHITEKGTKLFKLPAAPTSVSGNAGTATKFSSTRKIELTGDVTGSATADGSSGWSISATVADNSHKHKMNDITHSESASVAGLDPITSAYIGHAASNKSFGLPKEAIVIEYSTDGGTTWINYGATDAQIKSLFAETRSTSFSLGKCTTKETNSTNNMLRVTIEPLDRYVSFDGVYIWASTAGNTVAMDLSRSTIGAKDTFVNVFTNQEIGGQSGPNVRYFPSGTFGGGSNQTANTYKYRMVFKQTQISANNASAQIIDIRFLGLHVWNAPTSSPMTLNNHMYKWDTNFNVTFPAGINADSINNIELLSNTGTLASDGWKTLGGTKAGKKISISSNNSSATWNSGQYSASLLFGCLDTNGMIDIAYNTPTVSFAGGSVDNSNDDAPNWYFKLSGTTATTYNLDNFLTNGGTGSKSITLSKAGEIGFIANNTNKAHQVEFIVGSSGNGGIYDRTNTKWIVYSDVSGNVTLNGNANSATKATNDGDGNKISSTYLKLSGGTLTGNLTVSGTAPVINIKNTEGGESALVFERAASGKADWKIVNNGGNLYFKNNYTTTEGNYFDVLTLNYNSGNATFKGTVTAPTFSGTATSANGLNQSTISSLNTFTDASRLIYTAVGGSGAIEGKPTGIGAFGVVSLKTADGWYGQLLMSSNTATGLYWRTATSLSSATWRTILDSENVSTYALPISGGILTGEATIKGNAFQAINYISANTNGSATNGGLALYLNDPSVYGLALRSTANSGKHGYVQGDYGIYSYMSSPDGNPAKIEGRGWILRNVRSGQNVASVDTQGHAVFNGSLTVGGNATNDSGVRMEYNETTKSLNFIFN